MEAALLLPLLLTFSATFLFSVHSPARAVPRRLLYYLRGTNDLGIVYSPLPDGDPRTLRLITFGDSDWAGDQTTHRAL